MRRFYVVILILICTGCSLAPYQLEKINGVSFVASRDAIDSTHVSPVVNVNANYAAVMPFGFIRNLEHPEIIHNTDRQWYGETSAGTRQYIEALRKSHIKIMIKPQIWVWRGEFTGEIKMNSEQAWKELEASYTDFILEYAELAKEVNAEILCIGTELENFVKHRPEYWFELIASIKTFYKGKLTYAANWNEYEKTPFWAELDYIGIDAYFPISAMQTPTVADCLEGWKKDKQIIAKLSKDLNKQILFTEYGYRSTDFAGKKPWDVDRAKKIVNLEAQVNTTQALFETFWHEPWFAGGFVWKWFHNYDEVGGDDNARFTPQNKPAEAVIKSYYRIAN
jgi:hypothetical protein